MVSGATIGARRRVDEVPVDVDALNGAPVGVVMVSFNSLSVTTQAIYASFRYVRRPEFRLVVVDNASTDGSAEMLEALAPAGLCEVLLNAEQRYHGPGLNQGVNHLVAHRVARPDRAVRYVLALDSDCIVLRPDTLSSAVNLMAATGAGLVGQSVFDDWHHGGMMGLHCLLLDLAQVWGHRSRGSRSTAARPNTFSSQR
jgi:glycosyltransferase involved in cell wall biosynthesis